MCIAYILKLIYIYELHRKCGTLKMKQHPTWYLSQPKPNRINWQWHINCLQTVSEKYCCTFLQINRNRTVVRFVKRHLCVCVCAMSTYHIEKSWYQYIVCIFNITRKNREPLFFYRCNFLLIYSIFNIHLNIIKRMTEWPNDRIKMHNKYSEHQINLLKHRIKYISISVRWMKR